MATWANVKSKVVSLYQEGKLIPYVNVFRWPEGSQSNGALCSIIWKTFKLDFNITHAWLYGPDGAIDDTAADMTTFMNTVQNDMPWPSDAGSPETATLDDAYAGLLELE